MHAAFFHAQRNNVPKVILWYENVTARDRLAHLLNLAQFGQRRGVVHLHDRPIVFQYLIHYSGRCCNQVEIVLTLQPLLDNLHMQHAEKSAAKAESQRVRGLRFIKQGSIVQCELGQRIPEIFVVIRGDSKNTRVNLRLDALESRQRRHVGLACMYERIANRCAVNILDTRHDIAHLTGLQQILGYALGCEYPDAVYLL